MASAWYIPVSTSKPIIHLDVDTNRLYALMEPLLELEPRLPDSERWTKTGISWVGGSSVNVRVRGLWMELRGKDCDACGNGAITVLADGTDTERLGEILASYSDDPLWEVKER